MSTIIDQPRRAVARRRISRVTVAAVLSMGALGALLLTSALAGPHTIGSFELDGNAFNGAAAGEDWSDICPASTPIGKAPGCDGTNSATASTFDTDPLNQTIFTTGGSKDDLDLSNWQYTTGSVPDKDELMHAFAAQYTGSDDRVYLYFGADRFAANGDAQIGFWFFQNSVNLSGLPTGSGTFVDQNGDPALHEDGDLLVLSDFTKGGTQPTIRVFEWNGPGGSIAGSGEINGTLDQIGGTAAASKNCVGLDAAEPFCATVNTGLTDSPWDFNDKGGKNPDQFLKGEFYEGGVDLTHLGLDNECFSSFMAETRSSQSVDATLKDFVLGNFAVCGSLVTTQANHGGDGKIAIGDSITDTATVTGTGAGGNPPPPTGTVDFFLCGPFGTLAQASCNASGTPFDTQTLNGTDNPSTVTSDPVTPAAAGFYCFAAEYSGDDNYPSGADNGENECFEVTPAQPAITTTANSGTGLIGTTIFDNAVLSGLVNQPNGTPAGGTITYKLYGPFTGATSSSSCVDPPATGENLLATFTESVSGNGTYGGALINGFTATEPGTYLWVASYVPAAGDPNNLPVSGACNDANEASVITQVPSTIVTTQDVIPNDSATVSASSAADPITGSVTFRLYDDATECADNDPADALYSETIAVNGNSPVEVATSNDGTGTDGYRTSDDVTLYWNVSYSGDASHVESSSECTEQTAVDFSGQAP